MLAALLVLREKGPGLSRPYADTLKGSRYSNMKERRIQSRGDPLRAFFAFDPARTGIVLCAGNKVGNEKRFYDAMLPLADREFTNWLNALKIRSNAMGRTLEQLIADEKNDVVDEAQAMATDILLNIHLAELREKVQKRR